MLITYVVYETALTDLSTGFKQMEGTPLQTYPFSILHVELHPSPDKVLLSSHVSGDVIIPFPQIGEQILGDPVQP